MTADATFSDHETATPALSASDTRAPTGAATLSDAPWVAVVIPAYRVRQHVLDVIARIGEEVRAIYVVDDCCPQGSGDLVETTCRDARVKVIRHAVNEGVGGAVMSGYREALADGMDIVVKVDGDGQMDPALIPAFIAPIVDGDADYTKGNRFFDIEATQTMPRLRLVGNAALSFMTKLSAGYWDLFDPTNGYTAIHRDVANHLPFSKISRRYFFETDILFRLNVLRAVVIDIPMEALYAEEVSNLRITRVLPEFAFKHFRNFVKRVFYNYYLRDLSLASIELPLGLTLFAFGVIFGAVHWMISMRAGIATSAGTVMLAALPTLMGLQLILAFVGYDIASVPRRPFSRFSARRRKRA